MGQGRCEESILGNLKNDVDRFEIKHFSKSPDTAPISEPKYSSKGVVHCKVAIRHVRG